MIKKLEEIEKPLISIVFFSLVFALVLIQRIMRHTDENVRFDVVFIKSFQRFFCLRIF